MELVKTENMVRGVPRELEVVHPDDSPKPGAEGRGGVDFSDLAGSWTPDPAFDEILAAQRQIDPGKWT